MQRNGVYVGDDSVNPETIGSTISSFDLCPPTVALLDPYIKV